MPIVEVTIANKAYRLNVKEGGEITARALSQKVDSMMAELRKLDATMDRDTQLILTALQLASEFEEARTSEQSTVTAVGQFHRALAERLETLLT